MDPLSSLLSRSKDSLSSTRFVLLFSALVVLILIAASVIIALIRDHVTDGIIGLLGVATGFFISASGLKWAQGNQEIKATLADTPPPTDKTP